MYKKNKIGQIIRISDGALIPQDERNNDYQNFLKWQLAGGSPSQEVESQKDKNQNKINKNFEIINKKSQGKIFCDSILGLITNNLEKSGKTESQIDLIILENSALIESLQIGRVSKSRRLISEIVPNEFILTQNQKEKIIELIDTFLENERS